MRSQLISNARNDRFADGPYDVARLVLDHGFVVRFLSVEILPSSRRHGTADEDIQHGIENALVIEEVAEDPVRYLVLGPDQAGNLLELIVLDRPQGPAVIHAMRMRPKYRSLLPGSE